MTQADVAILGGGLAGLTLALQLRQLLPDLSIVVLERARFPVPVAAHKVGESTVEIGANYLDTVLGLGEHLRECHFKKFGFRFFFNDGRESIDEVTELGASRYLQTPGYQIDRGILENHLADKLRSVGVRLESGAVVRGVVLDGDGPHVVRYDQDGMAQSLSASWVVDASGRAGVIRRQLGLTIDNGHHANAVWFRLEARIDIDAWSTDARWHARCEHPERWLSTNHLVGPGYWVWLIPLSSGAHSVGIVADESLHALREMNSFPRALDWLERHQPKLARVVAQHRDKLMDFAALKHYSYGCREVFSATRWALTGEAGLFLDPFYSPGADFIAIANTYICELIARDRAGQSLSVHAKLYERIYFSFYESTLELYRDQYPLFGNADVMPAKVIWDYTYYWGILAQFFFQRRLADIEAMTQLRRELAGVQQLNRHVQALLRQWSEGHSAANGARMLDQAALPWFAELNRSLCDTLEDGSFLERIRANTALLHDLAREIAGRARADVPGIEIVALEAALTPPRGSPRAPLLFAPAV